MREIDVPQSISAAFDSVNLINELNVISELTEIQIKIKSVNVRHLQLMMSKDWFVDALTEEQTNQINSVI